MWTCFRKIVRAIMVEALMGAEVDNLGGALYSQSGAARVSHRNGYRDRRWDTRVGILLPLRKGSYYAGMAACPSPALGAGFGAGADGVLGARGRGVSIP